MRRLDVIVLTALLMAGAALVGGCKGPEVPNPLTGTTRYLCCNLYYEKTSIPDTNWQVGTKIPFGTPVHIDHVWRAGVQFTAEGHPPITIGYKHGDKVVPFETYLDRLFVEQDPRKKLRKVPAKRVEAIEQALVEPGMTKEQVLMARGIPPAHRTPSLDSPTWTYWRNRWDSQVVYFVGDKVDRIGH